MTGMAFGWIPAFFLISDLQDLGLRRFAEPLAFILAL
jgi:hypothetical protein